MRALREAARAAHGRLLEAVGPVGGHIERVSIDVELGAVREIVSLRMRGGQLVWSCTCGDLECEHALAALAFLTDAEPDAMTLGAVTAVDTPASRRSLAPGEGRTVEVSDQAPAADRAGLRAALELVVTAVWRSGVEAGLSASVVEAIEELAAAAPRPLPLGISRWLGRLREALDGRDVDAVARVLDGALRVIGDLGATAPDAEARRRLRSWMGALGDDPEGLERRSDVTLIELARERLAGIERGALERRYLVDLADGEVYREDLSPSAATASLGPCPRLLQVGLSTVEQGAAPRRIRLLQYAITPEIDAARWNELSQWASRSFEPLVERYRHAIGSFPGLAEPFALVAPERVSLQGELTLLDEAARPLPLWLSREHGSVELLRRLLGQSEIVWVAGRLLDRRGQLCMKPLSVATGRADGLCFNHL
ncbi:MAG: hypothetical protein OEZ06_22595 [Myxococcales bacterium]|nr:hypothetical protein [Myxococcales bacterium]